MENWIVKVIDRGYKHELDIYFFRRVGGKTEFLMADGSSVFCETIGESPEKPTLSLRPQALQALAQALADNGIKPQEGFFEGKLESTQSHLSDLRQLLKLK